MGKNYNKPETTDAIEPSDEMEVRADEPTSEGSEQAPPETTDAIEPSDILDTAPEMGTVKTHFCADSNKHCIAAYGVTRKPGLSETLACKECIGPASSYVSMRVLPK